MHAHKGSGMCQYLYVVMKSRGDFTHPHLPSTDCLHIATVVYSLASQLSHCIATAIAIAIAIAIAMLRCTNLSRIAIAIALNYR